MIENKFIIQIKISAKHSATAISKIIFEKILLINVIILSLCGCQKEIIVDIPNTTENPLFIEGMLYPGKNPRIYISKSQPFFAEDITPQEVFARGADVKITEASTVYQLLPDSIFNKFRCRWEPFYQGSFLPEEGKTYNLQINHEGRSYSASTTINQRKAVIDSVEYIAEFFDVYGGHDGVKMLISDPAGNGEYYRFQMKRMINKSVLHAHVLDEFINTCTADGELFPVTDIGRVVFSDEASDGGQMEFFIEVTYEYSEGDEGWISIQTLDENSARFYTNLDDQLQAIFNPFVEPVFIESQIKGAVGVFGSAVLSDSVLFVYPQDNP